MGLLFFLFYGFNIVSAILLTVFFDVFPEVKITFMLYAQMAVVVTLLASSYFGAKQLIHRRILFVRFGYVVSLLANLLLFYFGLLDSNNIMVGMSVLNLTIIFKGFAQTFNPEVRAYATYYHAYGAIASALYLPLNATGFFGLYEIYFANEFVTFQRAVESFGPILLLNLLADLFIYTRVSRKKKPVT